MVEAAASCIESRSLAWFIGASVGRVTCCLIDVTVVWETDTWYPDHRVADGMPRIDRRALIVGRRVG